jgi:hypothetical protein
MRRRRKFQQRINRMRLVEYQPLVDELNKIAAEEIRPRARITGEGYTDGVWDCRPAVPPRNMSLPIRVSAKARRRRSAG